jgi:hypothetical protein
MALSEIGTMKIISLLIASALIYPTSALAVTLTWPGPAPCNNAFVDCLVSTQSGDTVEIASNTTIATNVFISQPINLINKAGFKPKLAGLLSIQINAPKTSWQLSVRGIRFDGGAINLRTAASAQGLVVLEDNEFVNQGAQRSITATLSPPGDTQIALSISKNSFFHPQPVEPGLNVSMLIFSNSGFNDVLVYDNQFFPIPSAANPSASIAVTPMKFSVISGQTNIRVTRNRSFIGADGTAFNSGLGCEVNFGATANLLAHDNALVTSIYGGGSGIDLSASNAGTLNARVINNSVLDSYVGVKVSQGTGSRLQAKFDNNVFTGSVRFADIVTQAADGVVSFRNNLSYGFNDNNAPAGTLLVDPLLNSRHDPHLRTGSPALNAGSNAARNETGPGSFGALPLTDLEGFARIQNRHD